LDERTVLVRGEGAGAAVAAVTVADGAAKWNLDLVELTGQSAATVRAAWPAGDGGVALDLAVGDELQAVAAVDSAGQASLRDDARLLGAAGDLVAMRQGSKVMVAPADDLTKEKWSAEAPSERAGDAVLVSHDGTFWVWTEAGFVTAATGQPVGFGATEASSDAVYQLLEGGIVVRVTGASVVRIDPQTGKPLWERSVDLAGPATAYLVQDSLVVTGGDQVKWIDPASGAERQSVPVDRFIAVAGGEVFVLAADSEVTALKAANGGLRYQLKVPVEVWDAASFAFGTKTLYLVEGSTLRAHRLAKDGEQLWTLELPQAMSASPEASANGAVYHLHQAGGKLWVECGGFLAALS
jgi:outer membrane protein assembly factor BamB